MTFWARKKETAPILDLSKATANSKEEFRRLLEKVPDFKIKPERVPAEQIKIKDKNFKFKSGKKRIENYERAVCFYGSFTSGNEKFEN
ncbi:hypothetical protein NQ314_006744 [Rhamnusium bicolor]|uniref:Uncharacterized protein n=1 Tax=Rhamnusium bicolor TaxID=1586634 RepID=A0AAV8YXP9_9CUCU|nr:hypothetical protein NQ314_006744 [Rhamnusium bicolor]